MVMKIQNITQHQNFRGYKNFFCGDTHNDIARFSFISAQLDNNGTRDLDKLIEIKKSMAAINAECINTAADVFTLTYTNAPFLGENIHLDMTLLPAGEDLEVMDILKPYDKFNKKYFDFAMKAYTFMADITRKMQENPLYNSDANLKKVFMSTIAVFDNFFGNDKALSEKFLTQATNTNLEYSHIARNLNAVINETMKKFLL